MNNFLHKHFELVSAVMLAGAVGAICLQKNEERAQGENHVICAESFPSPQRYVCVTVDNGQNLNVTAHVPAHALRRP